MKFLKIIYSYEIDLKDKEFNEKSQKEFLIFLNKLIENSIKTINLCPKFKNCFLCIKKGGSCDLINNILKKRIILYYNISKGFKLVHFLWVLKEGGIDLVPKIILLHELINIIQESQLFILKRKYFFYENPYKNSRMEIFKNKIFDWSNYKNSIYTFNKVEFDNLIKNDEIEFQLYYFRPAFNFNLQNRKKLKLTREIKRTGKTNILNLSIFEFIINSDNLTKYLELISNHVILNKKKVIAEKILNSDSLIIDYKFIKILFNYIPKESTEFEFLSLLLKKGLLNLSRKDKNSRKYYE